MIEPGAEPSGRSQKSIESWKVCMPFRWLRWNRAGARNRPLRSNPSAGTATRSGAVSAATPETDKDVGE